MNWLSGVTNVIVPVAYHLIVFVAFDTGHIGVGEYYEVNATFPFFSEGRQSDSISVKGLML